MNFLTFSRRTEEPLPGLGLFRQSRHPERNREYTELAIKKRDAHCFNMELNRRCASYRAYGRQKLERKKTARLLSIKFPEDMANAIMEFHDLVDDKPELPRIPCAGYYHIKPKNEYKWYIMLSKITPYLPNTGLNPVHLHRYLKNGDFHTTYFMWIKKMNKLNHLQNGGLYIDHQQPFLTPDARTELYELMEHFYKEMRL
jgi:hypothetical protein